jgi:hypothetical protein
VLYIGRPDRGIGRAFRGAANGGTTPATKRRVQAYKDAEHIRVTIFATPDEAKQEEKKLIRLYKPIYNVHYLTKALQDESSLEKVKSTRYRIVDFLLSIGDHTAPRRDIQMRLSHRKDFKPIYQAMLDDKTLEEYGAGVRSSAKMVCLSFQALLKLNAVPSPIIK